ncbi:MMPL family transporter [Pedosphaera parvula]|uniref:Exporter of the RND superfamily n=1 Tax=Pedosphaera parvula (strain Ellin514) TaxID=320771 RepID=B9XI38_PEDPL|nr:MMPL family transporter [Pedosphaera parvula]EEF60531.1 exporter of the RND superfamily [Pedosphaera parvula Ellin514]
MNSLGDTLFGRALGRLADAIARHRWLFLWPQFFLFGLCVLYTVFHLQFDVSRDNLVGSDKKYHQNYLKFKKEFPTQDDLVTVVESENMDKNRQFVERLGAKLEAETNLFTDVFYKGDPTMMGSKALLFFPEKDLKELRVMLSDYIPFINKFTQATNMSSLFAMINYEFLHAKREANAENEAMVKAVPMLDRIVKEATSSLQRPGAPVSPAIYALFDAGNEAEQQIYITYDKGRVYLVTARAKTEELNGDAVDRLRTLVAQTEREVPGLNVGVTGEPVLEHDEMGQSQKDSMVASIVSLILCAAIFIYGYQETGRPLKATLCLIIGLGYTMGFTTLVVGHLNILTITFVPILIGLAIDFGVHLITRYEEELRLGRSEDAAMRKAIVYTGQGIFTGALTTAAAFGAMAFTNFKGIQEMGVICGGGMIVCFIPMMTLLPVLLYRGRQNAIDHEPRKIVAKPPAQVELRARIERIWLHRPITVIVITLFLTALSLTQFRKVFFDYDLLNMQSEGLPAVVFEKKLIDSASRTNDSGSRTNARSVLFAAVVADTPERAVELEKKLKKLPAVADVISMAPYIVEDASEKLKLIGEVKKEIAPIQFRPTDMAPVDLNKLSYTLYSTYGYMGAAAEAVKEDEAAAPLKPISLNFTNNSDNARVATAPAKEEPKLSDQLLTLRNSINDLRKQMLSMDPKVASEKLAAYQQALFDDVHETFQSLRDQDDSSRLQIKDLPPALYNRFIGKTHKYLLQVYPREDVWQRDKQEEFVKELRTVDPNVTGTPVQLYEYTTLLKDSYIQAAYYALAAIVIMVLIHFRSFASLLLALLPVAIGSIWMGGIMGFFNIPFNPANIMTLPLVIGIGVTNGIHILNRFAEDRDPGILAKSTGKAVFISGLNTIAGFGSLILAQHQGIRSLGYVMSTGVAMCMIASLTFLPAVLSLLSLRSGGAKKQPSGDNARSTLGREEPR